MGRGAQAVVVAATHRATGHPVAVKLSAGTGPLDSADQLMAEARRLAGLDHPFVIDVLDWRRTVAPVAGRPAGVAALVVERGTGSLANLDGPTRLAMPAELRRASLLQILDALAHLHARGWLHLDLKPANVLVGCRRRADQPLRGPLDGLRVADLGVAWRRQDDTRGLAGSPGWQAPEQAEGRSHHLGPWTDLYAAGLMARWWFPDASPALRDWIDGLLAPNPQDRPCFAAQAADALASLEMTEAERVRVLPATPSASLSTLVVAQVLDSQGPAVFPAPAPVAAVARPFARRRFGWPRRLLARLDAGLVRHRDVRLRGRDDVLQTLATRLTEGPRAIRLRGPAGIGRRTVARAFAQRSSELGLAWVVDVNGEGLRPPGVPWVVVVEGALPQWVNPWLATDGPGLALLCGAQPVPSAEAIDLDPLPDDAMEQLLLDRAPLHPESVAGLVADAEGRPGRAVRALEDALEAGSATVQDELLVLGRARTSIHLVPEAPDEAAALSAGEAALRALGRQQLRDAARLLVAAHRVLATMAGQRFGRHLAGLVRTVRAALPDDDPHEGWLSFLAASLSDVADEKERVAHELRARSVDPELRFLALVLLDGVYFNRRDPRLIDNLRELRAEAAALGPAAQYEADAIAVRPRPGVLSEDAYVDIAAFVDRESPDDPRCQVAHVKLAHFLSDQHAMRGHTVLRRQVLERALAESPHRGLRVITLGKLVDGMLTEGRYAEARPAVEDALALARDVGSRRQTALGLGRRGVVAMGEGDFIRAETSFTEALATEPDPNRANVLWIHLCLHALLTGDDAAFLARVERLPERYRSEVLDGTAGLLRAGAHALRGRHAEAAFAFAWAMERLEGRTGVAPVLTFRWLQVRVAPFAQRCAVALEAAVARLGWNPLEVEAWRPVLHPDD